MSPYYTERRLITTLCTPWPTPLVTVAENSYTQVQNCLCMITVPKSVAENSNILKLLSDLQLEGKGRFLTDYGRLPTSDGDPSTGTFHQMLVSVGKPPVV